MASQDESAITNTKDDGTDLEDERTPAEWRRMLLAYRLGEMEETRIEEIDERLITDEEFAAGMQATEYDLLDAYAAGELRLEEHGRVERALKPQNRFSLEAAGLLVRHSPVAAAPVSQTKVLPWRWVLPVAAAVLLAVLLPLVWRPEHGGKQSAAVASVPTQRSSERVAHVAMVLLPSTVRGVAPVAVRIGESVDQVQFEWAVAGGAPEAKGYELLVVTPQGKPQCQRRGVMVSGVVSFSCPAAAMASGDAFVRVMVAGAAVDDAPLMETAVTVRR